ncbi:hypothetical protein AVL62_08775 [Serinicoccus chungangensis]|uniref:Uncharacterized protein n=1 Tax=Serinicoccus chungangensis TaxID=767452 RepID=A0A0W8I137_9MICO|nr:hypothetical protein [Serinicoccus chungangensis]KUG51437.1 hypothetical protein AVL62_08775 [Serinicoccus chungangensis]
MLREVTGWTDWALHRDLGSALAEVPTEADRKALRAYLALRRRADDWRPNQVPARSNHAKANRAELAELLKGGTEGKPCAHCGEGFRATGRARYCTEACTRAARRTRERERRAA